MGIWITLPPQPGEETVCVKVGAIAIRGTDLALIGGLLVLTNQRLYHGPLNVRAAGKMLSWQAEGLGGSIAREAVTAFTDWMLQARAVDLSEIQSVEPLRRCSLRIATRDGQSREFAIAASATTPMWSRKNPPHRDEMVAAIRAAISRLPD